MHRGGIGSQDVAELELDTCRHLTRNILCYSVNFCICICSVGKTTVSWKFIHHHKSAKFLNARCRDWLFSTRFTLEVNLLILAFRWNVWTYLFAGIIFQPCIAQQVKLHIPLTCLLYTIYVKQTCVMLVDKFRTYSQIHARIKNGSLLVMSLCSQLYVHSKYCMNEDLSQP